MYHNSLRKSVPLAALLALAALGGTAAHAGQNVFDPNGTAAQLGGGASTTTPYPVGTPDSTSGGNNLYVPSPYSQAVGGQTVTFTTNGELTNGVFESFDSAGFDFAPGTQLLNTFDGRYPIGTTPNPFGSNGPLEIDFSTGVTAFGLQVQSAPADFEQFTFSTYNGSTFIDKSTSDVFDNFNPAVGKSLFLGAQATNGDVFTKVIISSKSFSNGVEQPENDNDFYFAPLSVVPVPEASSVVSLGMALALLGGVTLIPRRRRANRAS